MSMLFDFPRRPTLVSLIAAVCAVTAPAAAGAQQRASVHAASSFSNGNGSACGAAISAAMNARLRGISVSLLPAPITSANPTLLATPAASIAWQSRWRAWQLAAGGAVGSANSDCANLSSVSRGHVQLARLFSGGGIALSYASRSLSSLDPSVDRQGLTASAWKDFSDVQVGIDVRSRMAGTRGLSFSERVEREWEYHIHDTLVDSSYVDRAYTDTSEFETSQRNVDLRTRLHWRRGRLALDLVAGGTAARAGVTAAPTRVDSLGVGDDATTTRRSALVLRGWARGDIHFRATSFLDITGGLAALPEQPYLGAPARRVVSIGFSLSSLPRRGAASLPLPRAETASMELVRRDSMHVLVRLRIPRAQQVQLSGEPTAWTPVDMHRKAGDWWEAEVQARPGSYRMNVRVNGQQWSAPPGTIPTRDEFGGEVGVIQLK